MSQVLDIIVAAKCELQIILVALTVRPSCNGMILASSTFSNHNL